MSLTWILSEIETELRELVGMPGTSGLVTTAMRDRINDFYVNWFPDYVDVPELKGWWTFNTADSDTGSDEALPASVRTIDEPMTLKDSDANISKMEFYLDESAFFMLYPEDSHDEADERATPEAVLLYARTVYLRPKANAVFTFKAASRVRPTALTASTAPLNVQWGPAIAQGTAVMLKNRASDWEAALEKDEGFQAMIEIINRPALVQQTRGRRAIPRF